MLIVWLTEGHPQYPSMTALQDIAYISDVGAYGLKPLFITGCVITTVFLDLSFASERWLRHTGRLAKNLGATEKTLSGLSILFAIAGTAGLILLSIFDTQNHSRMHNGFLLLFIAGFILSAIFVCAEYQRLGVHFRQHRVLRLSFWLKLFFILCVLPPQAFLLLRELFDADFVLQTRSSACYCLWIIDGHWKSQFSCRSRVGDILYLHSLYPHVLRRPCSGQSKCPRTYKSRSDASTGSSKRINGDEWDSCTSGAVGHGTETMSFGCFTGMRKRL